MSADEKARSDSVRMLPSALRLKLSAVAESSSGASMTITMSYRPCVQNMSFTVTLVTEYGRPFTATAAANRKRLAGEGARLLASDQIANIDCPTEKRATI